MSTIVAVDTADIRFPTSLQLDGSDAMNPDPDYSAAYIIVRTDGLYYVYFEVTVEDAPDAAQRDVAYECIHGGTLVHFDAQGRVTLHRDYWDTAEELYEKLPVLGRLMRWLRQAGSTPLPPSPSPPC